MTAPHRLLTWADVHPDDTKPTDSRGLDSDRAADDYYAPKEVA